MSAFKLDTFSVSHGNSLYAGIPHSLLYFTLAQGPESARKSGASAFALLVSCCACFRFVFRTFVIYLLKVVGFSGEEEIKREETAPGDPRRGVKYSWWHVCSGCGSP